jgi:hypothetical protein
MDMRCIQGFTAIGVAVAAFAAADYDDDVLTAYWISPQAEETFSARDGKISSFFGVWDSLTETETQQRLDKLVLIPSKHEYDRHTKEGFSGDDDAQIEFRVCWGEKGIYLLAKCLDDYWVDMGVDSFFIGFADWGYDYCDLTFDKLNRQEMIDAGTTEDPEIFGRPGRYAWTKTHCQFTYRFGGVEPATEFAFYRYEPQTDGIFHYRFTFDEAADMLGDFALELVVGSDENIRMAEWFLPWETVTNRGMDIPSLYDKIGISFGYNDNDGDPMHCEMLRRYPGHGPWDRDYDIDASTGDTLDTIPRYDGLMDLEFGEDTLFGHYSEPVVPGITILSPNGGERFTFGDEIVISWEYTLLSGSQVSVALLYYNQSSQKLVSEDIGCAVPNTGTHSWIVDKLIDSESCLIRVTSSAYKFMYDESDSLFTITIPEGGKDIALLEPSNGYTIPAGEPYLIRWVSAGPVDDIITIEFSQDSGKEWDTIVPRTTNNGVYEWNVPDIEAQHCIIRIGSIINENNIDTCAGTFSIARIDSIIIITPTPGADQLLRAGSKYLLRWESIGTISKVKIECRPEEEDFWMTIIDSTPSDGGFLWTVPSVPMGSNRWRIRISSVDDSTIHDSNATVRTVDQDIVHATEIVLSDAITGYSFDRSSGALTVRFSAAQPSGVECDLFALDGCRIGGTPQKECAAGYHHIVVPGDTRRHSLRGKRVYILRVRIGKALFHRTVMAVY